MSNVIKKQLKQLIIILIVVLAVAGAVVGGIFLFSGDSGNDIETIKANGGYETLKADLESQLHVRSSQSGPIADVFFEDMGVTQYESMQTGITGKRASTRVTCDGYDIYCNIVGGEITVAYVGNVIVYKDEASAGNVSTTATEFTLPQYKNFVNAFTKKLKLSKEEGIALYEKMTELDIPSITGIKSGKLNGMKGFYATESNLTYFFTLNTQKEFDKMYIVCDGYDPILFYDIANPKGSIGIKEVKVLAGRRAGIAQVMSFRCKELLPEYDQVIFPAALNNGDDSWLMVKGPDGLVYIEVQGECVKGEKRQTKQFKIKVDDENQVLYMKMGNKTVVG